MDSLRREARTMWRFVTGRNGRHLRILGAILIVGAGLSVAVTRGAVPAAAAESWTAATLPDAGLSPSLPTLFASPAEPACPA